MSSATEVAYIIKGFPRLSETFIANEIYLLESMGIKLQLYSVKRGDRDKIHDVVGKIRAPLTYLPETTSLTGTGLYAWLKVNAPLFARDHRAVAARRPFYYLRTLLFALGMCLRYRDSFFAKPRKVYIKEFLQAGYIAAQVLDRPAVRHLHGHFCHGATTITWLVSRLTGIPFSFTAHAKDIYQGDLNPGNLLQHKLDAARFVTTCTGANHRHLEALYPNRRSLHTVYHGLDTDYFAPPGDSSARDTTALPLVLAVGRHVEKKGFAYLVEACAELKSAGVKFRCIIVGETGDQSERLATMRVALNLEDTLVLSKAMTQAELHKMYRQASVFALPCLITDDGDRDGIPNVLAEAMAMGLPIVSTAVSGIPEIVEHGLNGLLVPSKDSSALAGVLKQLIESSELRHSLGAAARQTICRCFDSRKTTQRLKELFLAELSMSAGR